MTVRYCDFCGGKMPDAHEGLIRKDAVEVNRDCCRFCMAKLEAILDRKQPWSVNWDAPKTEGK